MLHYFVVPTCRTANPSGECVRNRRKQTDSSDCRLRQGSKGRILVSVQLPFSASVNLKYFRGSPISRRSASVCVCTAPFPDTKRQVTSDWIASFVSICISIKLMKIQLKTLTAFYQSVIISEPLPSCCFSFAPCRAVLYVALFIDHNFRGNSRSKRAP